MKIEYVVMEGNPRGTQELFKSLDIDNAFLSEEAAEAVIANFFEKNLNQDGLVLFVLKTFKKSEN